MVTSSKDPATPSKGTAPVSHINVETSPRLRSLRQIRLLKENFDKGYDSDGECGPFMTMEDVEGEHIFDEPELGERASDELGTKDGATVVKNYDYADEDISNEVEGGDIDHTEGDSTAAYQIPIDEADLMKMIRDAIKNVFALETRKSCWEE